MFHMFPVDGARLPILESKIIGKYPPFHVVGAELGHSVHEEWN